MQQGENWPFGEVLDATGVAPAAAADAAPEATEAALPAVHPVLRYFQPARA